MHEICDRRYLTRCILGPCMQGMKLFATQLYILSMYKTRRMCTCEAIAALHAQNLNLCVGYDFLCHLAISIGHYLF